MRRTHGKSGTKIYLLWAGMISRCFTPSASGFEHYGGRGITVCDRWRRGEGGLSGFECFLADMGERPSKAHSIERDDNDGPYEPKNCRWATLIEQRRNTRQTRRIEHGGETLTAAQWADRTGISAAEIVRRLNRGWSAGRAVTQKPRIVRRMVICSQ